MTGTHTKRIHPGPNAAEISGTQPIAGAHCDAAGCEKPAIQHIAWSQRQGNRYGTGHTARHTRNLCADHAWRVKAS